MLGRIAALYRHPVKGFTPEPLETVRLDAGAFFPGDRMFALENGPSGFDENAPRHISKFHFAVLATLPQLVKARTQFDDRTAVLHIRADHRPHVAFPLATAEGRRAFAAWIQGFVGEANLDGPLRLALAPGHRFTDNAQGHVSLINLASLRDLEAKLGVPVDPLRFRANIHVDGWPAWAELDLADGKGVGLGAARLRAFKRIVRCIATHADPLTGARDIDICGALKSLYGHVFFGVYLNVGEGGALRVGDEAASEYEPNAKLDLAPMA
jgi:uncharacterized protein YcbX